MITDVQLAIFANMLGVSLFLLVVLYHYVAVWQRGRTLSSALEVSLDAIRSAFANCLPANDIARDTDRPALTVRR